MPDAGLPGAPVLIAASRVIPAAAGPAVLEPGYVAAAGGRITEVGAGPPPADPDIRLDGGVLVPGFVDLQVNGFYGTDLVDGDPVGWARVVQRLPETGTTAFLPTYITAPVAELAASLRKARKMAEEVPKGARILGVHLEGPFLSRARPGAHRPDWMVPPSAAAVAELLAAGQGVLRMVTLAPEVDGALAAAADAGARMVTHLFNAQRGLHHREPGVVGQALTDPRLTSGLIVDLAHVAASVCALAFAAAPGRICLVTDATAGAGMPPGRYVLGGEPVELPPGGGAPVRRDGTLAGSALRMDLALANAVGVGLGWPRRWPRRPGSRRT